MKTSILNILISVIVSALLTIVIIRLSAKTQIAYVDSSKIINGYKGMEEVRAKFQSKASLWKANIDTLVSEVQNEMKKYEKESSRMSAKERDLAKELIKIKQQQLADYQKATSENAKQEDIQMTQTVIEEINKYVVDYGSKHDYKIIFGTTEYGNIVYAEEGMDITEEVLTGLNKKYTDK